MNRICDMGSYGYLVQGDGYHFKFGGGISFDIPVTARIESNSNWALLAPKDFICNHLKTATSLKFE
jgi:hypothetical protein